MSVNQIKKDYEKFENFNLLTFPSFGSYSITFISKDLVDPIICFLRSNPTSGGTFKIKINDESYDISSSCFPNVKSDIVIQINDDDTILQDLDLLTPLFQGKEFCICLQNLDLFQLISKYIGDDELLRVYNYANDFFDQSKKLLDLCELEEEIFNLNLDYFTDFIENEAEKTEKQNKKIDKNYTARFLYELGWSNTSNSPQIAKFAKDLCDIIDSEDIIQEKNDKSLRDTISEYFLLRLTMHKDFELDLFSSKSQHRFYLYRQFYDNGLIDKDELLEVIFSLDNYRGLMWFLDILPKHMEQLMRDLIQEVGISYLEKTIPYIEELSANNFEKFKQIISQPETENNSYTKVIRNDDVDQLQKILSHLKCGNNSNNIKVGTLTFEVAEFLNNTRLINYAAFFGSVKCFKYLLMNGSEIQSQTVEFAIYGQNTEIIRIIEQNHRINSESIVTSVITNKNNIFDWLLDNGKTLDSKLCTTCTKQSVRYCNFHAFLNLYSRNTNWTDLKKDSIKYGNYELYKFLTMISNENSDNKVKIFDYPTYSAIKNSKYPMKNFSTSLESYQIDNSFELFQMFIKDKHSQIPNLNEWFSSSIKNKNYFLIKYLSLYHDFSDYINQHPSGFLRNEVVDRNCPSILYLILQNDKVDINVTPQNRQGTAFTLATWESYIACTRILYNRGGVDINAIGNIGETPLTGAIMSNKPSVVSLLVSFDDIEINKPNSRGLTPFQISCQVSSRYQSLIILLKKNDLEFEMEEIQEQFERAFLSNQVDLMKAIYYHPRTNINQLNLESICQFKDLKGVNLHTICALSELMENKKDSFMKLVRRVSDPILYISLSNSEKFSDILYEEELYPLHYAIKAKKTETIDYLLQYPQIDVNLVNPKKKITPLIQAIISEDVDIDIFNRFLSCDRLDFNFNESIVGGESNFLNLFIQSKKYRELNSYMKKKIKSIDMISDDFFVFLVDNHLYDYVMMIIESGYRSELINYAFISSIKNPTKNKYLQRILIEDHEDNNEQISRSLFDFLIDLESKNEISLNLNYKNFNDNGKTALMESIDSDRPELFDTLIKMKGNDIDTKDYNDSSAYDYAESQLIHTGKEHYLKLIINGQKIDLIQSSFNDKNLTRIDLIIDSKNDKIFNFILSNFDKEQLSKTCQKVDLSLISKNIAFFRSSTLLLFIEIASDRILETVNDDCSFIYHFLRFYLINGYDEIINFRNTEYLEKFIKMGFDINSADKNGDTLCMCAIKNQKFEAFLTFLLIEGLDLKIKNKENKDAAQIAKELDHDSVAKIIEKMIHDEKIYN